MSMGGIHQFTASGDVQLAEGLSMLANEPPKPADWQQNRIHDVSSQWPKAIAPKGYCEEEQMSFVTTQLKALRAEQFSAHAHMYRAAWEVVYGNVGGYNGRGLARVKGGLW